MERLFVISGEIVVCLKNYDVLINHFPIFGDLI